MATREDLTKAEERLEGLRAAYKDAEYPRKLMTKIAVVSLCSLAYVGLRHLVGPDFEVVENPKNLIQFLDGVALGVGAIGVIAGLCAPLYRLIEREQKDMMREAEQDLTRLQEDYAFSRGHI